jgi:hypothetical protein
MLPSFCDTMGKFTHYLITRFNVPENRWLTDKTGHVTLDDPWLNHRLSLFTSYCIPSVYQQTQQNFQWIIYCDSQADQNQITRIRETISYLSNTQIRLVATHGEMLTDLRLLVSQAETPYVITSRLDNDDALGQSYIETIQASFTEQDKVLLHADEGITYDVTRHVATRMRSKTYNHFTSLIETTTRPGDMLTVYGFHHTDIPSPVVVKHITDGYHWMKIIHERNVRSRLKGIPIFQIPEGIGENIDRKKLAISWISTIGYLISRILKRRSKG